MKIKIVIVATLFLLSGNSGTTGKLSGKITSAETKQPVKWATVTIFPGNVILSADSVGYYECSSVLSGVYEVEAMSPGYCKIYKTNIRILPDYTTRLNFELLPESRPLSREDSSSLSDIEKIMSLPTREFKIFAPSSSGHWFLKDSSADDTTNRK